MKLNFWQWLGVVLVIIAVVALATRKANAPGTPDQPAAATQAN